ncbi:helix-turn-helix domain-containing protein [Streptomyces sp. NBC_00212]|uniref:helix-turn-helix domain-containing protein n=1 Tax=Streptomyces sp. NBC_00212 TaxID=2975684 RepID=UPI0032469CE8
MPLYRPKAPRRPLQSADAACLFGRRLQRLVEAAHLEGKARFTDTEIAAYVGVSGQYIRNLRGGKSMPSVEKAQRLAEFFGVDHADYFLKPDDDPAVVATERRLRSHKDARPEGDRALEEDTAAQERWLQVREDHGVREIALRAGQLSPEARSAVLGIVEELIRSESHPELGVEE